MLRGAEKAINMSVQDEGYSWVNSERFEQRNALTVELIELTKQIKRVAFFIGSLQCYYSCKYWHSDLT